MKLLMSLAAAAAILASLALASPAAAQFCDNCGPIQGGGGSGGDGKSYEAGEPFNPFPDGYLRDQKGGDDNPNGDPNLPGYLAGLPLCKTELGDMPRVRARAIDKVDHGVDVVAICTNHNLMDQQDGMASIRSAIDGNDAMHKALRAAGGFSANDVVAIVLDGEGAKLYVHVARSASR